MRAVVVSKYGAPEGLQLQEVDTPIPEDNELLIKIHATTVTFGDAMLRRMKLPVRMVFGGTREKQDIRSRICWCG